MPSTELLIAFFATTAIFAYIPGPAMLYAAAQTMARGRWSGLTAALGIHLGGYVHVVAAAAGLSVLFHAVPTLYMAVKLAGALYLIWLGVSLFRARAQDDAVISGIEPKSARRAFFESITVEVLNPKTAIFFMAFLPQFIDASATFPVWLQFLVLGTIVNLMFSSADVMCVVLAGALITRLRRSSHAQRLMRRAGGAVLVGLGVHVALQKS
ncbi:MULTISPECIES: LysE family translocator [Mesorhizobium]|jgi:threonine/homoserine/homoserine lactone efflux protein|uniref:Threonine/homoserine/homoserine lactone efflux protein n=1 Tax=Mesorhizobium muleiense TaxID=1004279 RepID=A0A1G8WMW2_9HYPH|nr:MULTISPECIES: LysE family translocator [Mesorhizobium]MCF6097859.1 LysE family translocator [Mesorhizobium muleiense]MCF6111753.1 LysE family translocator [Mesorhizobium muleiense]RWN53225.1 MAG: LysE family translocator [Mesorhizobium sp.]RWO51473.1 MAG: LysE family translocator [Mesorhizobium sp.]TIM04707.1 MAG: LysE family translocator [Mesorhizobium sp.]